MPDPPAVTPTALRAHDGTIRRMTTIADAVLPFRFGSMVDGELDLARRLEPGEAALEAALEQVAGREQMTVRVYERTAPGAGSPRDGADAPVTDDLGPGARYLLARRRLHEGDPRRGAALEAVLAVNATIIRAQRVEPHASPPLIASVHHLIERGHDEAYAAALQAGTAELVGAAVTVSGPWPPYAFASEALA
jgi:hypothetical protein